MNDKRVSFPRLNLATYNCVAINLSGAVERTAADEGLEAQAGKDNTIRSTAYYSPSPRGTERHSYLEVMAFREKAIGFALVYQIRPSARVPRPAPRLAPRSAERKNGQALAWLSQIEEQIEVRCELRFHYNGEQFHSVVSLPMNTTLPDAPIDEIRGFRGIRRASPDDPLEFWCVLDQPTKNISLTIGFTHTTGMSPDAVKSILDQGHNIAQRLVRPI